MSHTRPTIAITSTTFSRTDSLIRELEEAGFRVVGNTEGKKLKGASLAAFFNDAEAEAVIVGIEPINDALLAACPRLKLISKYGVGLDNLDLEAMARHGVLLGWSGGINRRSVSELVLGFALGHCRNIARSLVKMRRGEWDKDGGRQLSNTTVGIVGFGHIGSDLAALLKPFGCPVIYTDILDKSKEASLLGATPATYEKLVAEADVISFHVPSTPLTRQMFGSREIARMKPTALVVNTARGDIVDFTTCCQAVRDGRLGGFAADVFPEEPVDVRHWSDVMGLYFTPHIGGNAREAVQAMGQAAIGHVVKFYRDKGR